MDIKFDVFSNVFLICIDKSSSSFLQKSISNLFSLYSKTFWTQHNIN